MKEYISIRKLGPLQNVDSMQIKPFTVLIGESASGKSTLMKVISMMRYLYKMANIRSYLRHSKITKSPFRMNFRSLVSENGLDKLVVAGSEISYIVEIEDTTRYEIRVEDGKLKPLPIVDVNHLMFNKVSFISENRNIIPTWTQKASQNAGATLGFYFHETNKDFSLASKDDKTVTLDYIGMKLQITHPKGKPTRYTVAPNDGRHLPIELRDASSGIQTSVPAILITKDMAQSFSFKDAFQRSVLKYLYESERLTKFKAIVEPTELQKVVFIHIEEPELSLFPNAQCKLIEDLVNVSTHAVSDRTVNLMLATHSPYILNYLNIILNQTDETRAKLSEEELSVYRIFDGTIQDLAVKDDHDRWIVDTYDLTEMMSSIYDEFVRLGV